MTTDPKIYKAVMELAKADHWGVDKVFEELWNDAQAKTTPKAKRHFMLASDIAALVRDRLKIRNRNKMQCTSCGNVQELRPLELPICDECGGGMFVNVIEVRGFKKK